MILCHTSLTTDRIVVLAMVFYFHLLKQTVQTLRFFRFHIFSSLSCLVLDQLVAAALQEIPIVRDEEHVVEMQKKTRQEPVEDAAIVEGCRIVKRCSPLLVFCLKRH